MPMHEVIVTVVEQEEHAGATWPVTRVYRFEMDDIGATEHVLDHLMDRCVDGGQLVHGTDKIDDDDVTDLSTIGDTIAMVRLREPDPTYGRSRTPDQDQKS